MHELITKYYNECLNTVNCLPVGDKAVYENKVFVVKAYDWTAYDVYLSSDTESQELIGVDMTKVTPYTCQRLILD